MRAIIKTAYRNGITRSRWSAGETVPIDTLDNKLWCVREKSVTYRVQKPSGSVVDWVVDKHNNLFLLTNEGASNGLSLAPANKRERVRLLATIPNLNRIHENDGSHGVGRKQGIDLSVIYGYRTDPLLQSGKDELNIRMAKWHYP